MIAIGGSKKEKKKVEFDHERKWPKEKIIIMKLYIYIVIESYAKKKMYSILMFFFFFSYAVFY